MHFWPNQDLQPQPSQHLYSFAIYPWAQPHPLLSFWSCGLRWAFSWSSETCLLLRMHSQSQAGSQSGSPSDFLPTWMTPSRNQLLARMARVVPETAVGVSPWARAHNQRGASCRCTCVYTYVHRVHACVCTCPILSKNGVRNGYGHTDRNQQNLREQMRRIKCSHGERNANTCQERERKRGPKRKLYWVVRHGVKRITWRYEY